VAKPPRAVIVAALALGLGAIGLGVVVIVLGPFRDPPPVSAERGPGDPTAVYQAEQRVDIWHAGRWYPGVIHAVGESSYFVTYDGFSKSWHEWVDASRLRAKP
jgi:hypothetical protein